MSAERRIVFELFFVAVVIVLVTYGMIIFGILGTVQTQLVSVVLVVITTATLAMMFVLFYRTFQVQRSYHVAVIGFPSSGKTTLITSLFGEAFARQLPIKLAPRGTQTIERINKFLETQRKGKTLGPTRDQDMFAFRADATLGRFPFRTTIRLEFGDFPGHYSEAQIDNMAILHNTEFFKWVADSDAIIFVIDLARYLSNVRARQNYVAEVTSRFRAAWQQYLDTNRYRTKEVQRHPVLLVFNKSDLMYRCPAGINLADIEKMTATEVKSIEEMSADLGFGVDIPPIIEIDKMRLDSDKIIIEQDFAEIISYFKAEASRTDVVFTSSFGTLKGKRLGIGALFLSVLKGAI